MPLAIEDGWRVPRAREQLSDHRSASGLINLLLRRSGLQILLLMAAFMVARYKQAPVSYAPCQPPPRTIRYTTSL
jgi:hypothetical protein